MARSAARLAAALVVAGPLATMTVPSPAAEEGAGQLRTWSSAPDPAHEVHGAPVPGLADAPRRARAGQDLAQGYRLAANGNQGPGADEDQPADRPPGRIVVSPEEAERALERSLVQTGGLLLRPGQLELEPSLGFSRQEDASPTTVTQGGNTVLARREREVNEFTADLTLRVGLPLDSQLELAVPYRVRNVDRVDEVGFSTVGETSSTGSGVGNLRIGLAKTVLREARWRPDLIARVRWDTRTGTDRDDDVRISSDFNELQLSATAIKRQDPLVFIGGLAVERTEERNDIQPGAAITPSTGAFVALSPQTSLRFLFSATFQDETKVDGDDMPGSDQTAATFTVGASSLLAEGVLTNVSLDIGLTDDADDFAVRWALPVRF